MSRSDGAIALARTSKTHEEIAKLIGVSRVAITHWVAGTKKPTPERRVKLFELFGIPVASWERADKKRDSAFQRAVAAAVTSDVSGADWKRSPRSAGSRSSGWRSITPVSGPLIS